MSVINSNASCLINFITALLPAPIIFGNIIDTTCLWWKYECEKRKNCLIYDLETFRYKLIGNYLEYLMICTNIFGNRIFY